MFEWLHYNVPKEVWMSGV